jgi:hypothetical protein
MSEGSIVALIAALLPIAATTLFAWLERRGREARRDSTIEAAQKRIQFLQTYLATKSLALPDEQLQSLRLTISEEVDRIFREMHEELAGVEETLRKSKGRSLVQRIFLFYRMKTLSATVFRTLFHVALLLAVLVSFFFAVGFDPSRYETSLLAGILGLLVLLLPLVLPALLFRALAIRQDKA